MEKFGIKNHITIPGFAIVELGLSGNELICYSLIYGFCQDGESEFYGSISYLESALNITRRGVFNVIQSLEKKGYVIKKDEYVNGVKYCKYTISNDVMNKIHQGGSEKTSPVVKKYHQGGEKSSQGVVKNFHNGGEKSSPNNINNNISNNINNNITAEAEVVTDENDYRYQKFNEWLKDNAPHILKLQRPFTKEEFIKLKSDFDTNTIMGLCLEMENYKDLVKKYTSANLTFRSWARRRQSNKTIASNGSKQSTREQRIASIDEYLASKYQGSLGNN